MLFSFFDEGVRWTLSASAPRAQHEIYITATLAPTTHPPRSAAMSKGMDQKKNVKKKAAKTPDEKRAAKKAKKAERSFIQRP
jgi:hypothetical protein